ncbi:MAG TPA: phosphate acetyltransferase [Bacteroidetes bacterium]|nr:phosphate acetyltransferase [Bacteroidota bacterium]
MADHLLKKKIRKTIAVAVAEDPNTMGALFRAVQAGFARAVFLGKAARIRELALEETGRDDWFILEDVPAEKEAVYRAMNMVREGEADVLMKGLVGTDLFLRAVLDKEKGLLPPDTVMSYVCAIQLPRYPKLLFVTDTAVLPYPDLKQKAAMLRYAVNMARRFGIGQPRVALIGASEKISENIHTSTDAALLCKMVERGQLPECVIDGPLDIFLACDPESVRIKGVHTPVNGEADILLFPTLEACNAFYKGLMLFGGGELAGLIQGTTKPVVVMSRSESPASKYYCVALSCLMAEENT